MGFSAPLSGSKHLREGQESINDSAVVALCLQEPAGGYSGSFSETPSLVPSQPADLRTFLLAAVLPQPWMSPEALDTLPGIAACCHVRRGGHNLVFVRERKTDLLLNGIKTLLLIYLLRMKTTNWTGIYVLQASGEFRATSHQPF